MVSVYMQVSNILSRKNSLLALRYTSVDLAWLLSLKYVEMTVSVSSLSLLISKHSKKKYQKGGKLTT